MIQESVGRSVRELSENLSENLENMESFVKYGKSLSHGIARENKTLLNFLDIFWVAAN